MVMEACEQTGSVLPAIVGARLPLSITGGIVSITVGATVGSKEGVPVGTVVGM
jgi:hypothetical protein